MPERKLRVNLALAIFASKDNFSKPFMTSSPKKGAHLFKITSLRLVFGKGAVLSYQTFLL